MTDQDPPQSLIAGERRTVMRWSVAAPINQDAYWINLVRYVVIEADGQTEFEESHYLHDGAWHPFKAYDVIRPVLVLEGQLLHALASAGAVHLDRGTVAQELERLLITAWNAAVEAGIEPRLRDEAEISS